MMLNCIRADDFKAIYIRYGYTDLRYGEVGLTSLVKLQYEVDPYEKNTLFLFCGRKRDRFKGIIYDGTGMIIFTKRMSGDNRIQWPRNEEDLKKITYEQLNQLLSGYTITSTVKEYRPKYR